MFTLGSFSWYEEVKNCGFFRNNEVLRLCRYLAYKNFKYERFAAESEFDLKHFREMGKAKTRVDFKFQGQKRGRVRETQKVGC